MWLLAVQAFKYNTLETLYLSTAMFILLSGAYCVCFDGLCPAVTMLCRVCFATTMHRDALPRLVMSVSRGGACCLCVCCTGSPSANVLECVVALGVFAAVALPPLALPGMAFQSGVAAVNSTPHLALTWLVAIVLVACIFLFLSMLSVEVWRSVQFARRMHAVRKASSAPSSPVGRAPLGNVPFIDNPLLVLKGRSNMSSLEGIVTVTGPWDPNGKSGDKVSGEALSGGPSGDPRDPAP